MKTHSHKRVDIRCEDCEFCGENELTKQVHLGKQHSENFECGLDLWQIILKVYIFIYIYM